MGLFGKDTPKPETIKDQFIESPTSNIEPETVVSPEPKKDSTPSIYAKIPLLLIREPIKTDSEQIYQLGLSIPELASKDGEPWLSKSDVDHHVSYSTDDCLVAELNGKIVGFVITQKEGWEHICIVFIGIHPDYRKSGIGKYLMTQIESKQSSVNDFYLFATSDKAVTYFEGLGYQKGKTMTYMRKTVDK